MFSGRLMIDWQGHLKLAAQGLAALGIAAGVLAMAYCLVLGRGPGSGSSSETTEPGGQNATIDRNGASGGSSSGKVQIKDRGSRSPVGYIEPASSTGTGPQPAASKTPASRVQTASPEEQARAMTEGVNKFLDHQIREAEAAGRYDLAEKLRENRRN
ncbi:MAG: hypothetical protein RDV41_08145 [Planctomycetota bacterium]|nr:hypothetical protein [Planctomycetota bacterium]